ncbi:TetR/AcrR family transcriptional regulator [Prolixibacteraceae bacterium JC049]|nr:TetR/AcrR family transcriptional regulator [Prolixibacteraceae bacterium JC049]
MQAISKEEKAKEEILLQAQKLFQQFGLKKTTMDDLASACSKAKSTLYHYFKSKHEVFDAVIDLEMTSLQAIIQSKVAEVDTISEKLTIYIITFHAEVTKMANLYRIIQNELAHEAFTHKQFRRMFSFEQAYISKLLQEGIDKNEIKEIDSDEIDWFAEMLIAAFFGVVQHSIESDNGLDHEKLTKTANRLIPRFIT